MKLNRKWLTFILVVTIGTTGALIYRYIDSFASLTVTTTQDGKMTLYEAGFIDGSDFIVEESALKITNNTPVRTGKGEYLLIYTNDRHETIKKAVHLDNDMTVSLEPQLTQEDLNGLLANEKSDIHSSLSKEYPSIFEIYSVDYEKLYLDGNWYGAVFSYNDKSSHQRDSIRVILKKNGDEWKVYTKPYLTINLIDYPTIPRAILEDINTSTASDKANYDHPSHAPEPYVE